MKNTLMVMFLIANVQYCRANYNCTSYEITGYNAIIHANNIDGKCRWKVFPPIHTITVFQVISFNKYTCEDKSFELEFFSGLDHFKFCDNTNISIVSFKESFPIIINYRSIKNTIIKYSARNLSECSEYEFQCYDKSGCYSSSHVCDSKSHCKDKTDEINCGRCNYGLSPCSNSSKCFSPMDDRCDGKLVCPLGDDELDCDILCPYKISCGNEKTCIEGESVCNGFEDCSNKFDEQECGERLCTETDYFLCDNGRCISKQLVNNNESDCEDGSDEKSNYITKPLISMILTFALLFAIVSTFFAYFWLKEKGLCGNQVRRNRDFEENRRNNNYQKPASSYLQDEMPDELRNNDIRDEDFGPGGEIFQSYIESKRLLQNNRTRAFTIKDKYPEPPKGIDYRNVKDELMLPTLSRNKTIADLVEEFYEDEYSLDLNTNCRIPENSNYKDLKILEGIKNIFSNNRIQSKNEAENEDSNSFDFSSFTIRK